jgi:DEAD/DEAH box helicase domain-containing protein
LKNKNKIIGYRNMPMAMHELYQGAIYFLDGQRYISNGIEINNNIGIAKIEKIDNNYPYYNKPLLEEYPEIKKIINKKKIFGLEVQQIELSIKKSVIGYVNIKIGSEERKGEKNYLDKPIRYNFLTKGIVFNAPVPQSIIKNLKEDIDKKMASSYHATEHVIIEGTDMITGGVSKDMGGLAMGTSGLIFIYDAAVGGNGATQILFDKLEDAIKRAYKMIKECPCISEDGCPRCTYSYRCGNNNEYLDKKGAEEVLFRIINKESKYIGKPVDNEKTFT